MIKKIIFKKKNTLAEEYVHINFSSKTNIIIGPKGGGKSTLFDLVAGLEESYISKNVTEALADFDLEFHKVIKFNGEEIQSNNLTKISATEKTNRFKERFDVIYQDDPIKKNLNNRKEIEKAKNDFAKGECQKSEDVENLFKQINSFFYGMQTLAERNKSNDINWTNTFSVTDVFSTENDLMLNLNYSNNELNTNVLKETDILNKELINYSNQLINNKKLLQHEWNKDIVEETFISEMNKSIQKNIASLEELINIIKKELSRLKKINLLSNLFKKAYISKVDEIKNKDFEMEGIKSFMIKSKEHFKSMAREVQTQKRTFESMLQEGVVLEFDDSIKDNSLLSYQMPKIVTLSDDNIYGLLKVVLPTPGSSVSDITKWLGAIIDKGVKDFDRNKLLNKLSKILQEEVNVLANGRIYDHMSLGQRSIYGIKYKFNKSKGQNLFLDQPEDNLDNHTIASDILELINERQEQVFIVTHNANIGILSNPGTTIVADLNNDQEQYSEGTIIKTESGDSDAAHYLEGGVAYLKKRYNKIEGEKHDTYN